MKMLESTNEDEVVESFTKNLNEALNRRDAQKKAEAEKAAREKAKTDRAEEVATALNKFLKEYYPDLEGNYTAKEVIELCDSTKRLHNGFKTMFSTTSKEDPIAKFLKENKLW